MTWSKEETRFLALHYPEKGRKWVAKALNRTEGQIRSKASREKIYQDSESDFAKEWQKRAAQSKIGKKRPDQAKVIGHTRAQNKLKMTDLGRKAISVAMKKRIALNGHNRGMLGKKHSAETKKKFSQIVKDRWKNMTDKQKKDKTFKMMRSRVRNGTYAPPRKGTTWKAGWREFGGKRKYYRSRWEANYGRYLEYLKSKAIIKDWFHEPDVFWFEGIKRGCVSYLPDFKVINTDDSVAYHEVKGWMDKASKTKIKRMAKFHPTVKLIVICQKAYEEIMCKLGRVIPDWE